MTLEVYSAINAVSTELAKIGIGKTRRNDEQRYNFRGIDEVMNALSPLLSKHKLIVFPRMMSRASETRTTRSGGAIYSVSVHAEFDFVSSVDGSKHTVSTFGEGMDTGDKATNKATSAAYKYAAFMTFCIPLEGSGDVDADATTPEETRPAVATSLRVGALPPPSTTSAAQYATTTSGPAFVPEDVEAPVTTPASDPKIIGVERRRVSNEALKAKSSAEIKDNLLLHLKRMVPGKTTWDQEWQVYAQTKKSADRNLSISDRAIVSRAENRRIDQHKAERARELEATA